MGRIEGTTSPAITPCCSVNSAIIRGVMWVLKSFGRSLRLCKRIALYESMKSRKIAAVMHGWWDGVRGNMGRRSYRPVQRGLRFSVNARVPSLRSSERTTR